MCTLMYSTNRKIIPTLLSHLRDRSRDAFGAKINGEKITNTDFAQFSIDVLKQVNDFGVRTNSTIFLYGRAIPESEPDYFNGTEEAVQPIYLSNIESGGIVPSFGFHGLVNEINGKKIDNDIVDTHALAEFINSEDVSNLLIYNPDPKEIYHIFEKNLKGSYLIFIEISDGGIHRSLFVITNFLSCFYNPADKYVSSVPISSSDIKLEPYSCYCFSIYSLEKRYSYCSKPSNEKIGIIGSGGLDSSTVLALNRFLNNNADITLFHFSYGQDSDKDELKTVEKLAQIYDTNLQVIDAKKLFDICDKNSLLLKKNTSNADIDTLTDMERDVHYVSMRNSIFSIISASLCEKYNISKLSLGVNLTEGLVYTDNGNRWFYSMQDLLKTAGKQYIRFTAPLLNLLKYEIIQIGQLTNAHYESTISCYHPFGAACGKCGSCMNRIRAFAKNGFRDPISYITYPEEFKNLPVYKPAPNKIKLISLLNKYHIEV